MNVKKKRNKTDISFKKSYKTKRKKAHFIRNSNEIALRSTSRINFYYFFFIFKRKWRKLVRTKIKIKLDDNAVLFNWISIQIEALVVSINFI